VAGYAETSYTQTDILHGFPEPLNIAPDGTVIGVTHAGSDDPDDDLAAFGWNFRFTPAGLVEDHFAIAPASFDDAYDYEQVDSPVIVQPDGKIVAVGPEARLFRSNGDGTLDPTFGNHGINDNASGYDFLDAAPDGSILSFAPGGSDSMVRIQRLF